LGDRAAVGSAGARERVLYFDLDGTVIHSGFGSVKKALADGVLERAIRSAGFDRLVCVANAVAIVRALEDLGRRVDGLDIILQLTSGAFADEAWFRRVTTLVVDPRRRARYLDFSADWWWVDDLAQRYLTQEGMADRFTRHSGERIFAPDPEGDGQDVLDWLHGIPPIGRPG
jgi:hypothetical protein